MTRRQNSNIADAVTTSVTAVAVLYLVAVADTLFHLSLARFGIVPRTGPGLVGIVFSPLLHANLRHVIANTVPLFLLLLLLLSSPRYHPCRTLAWIWVASGLGTWLIGRGDSVHIGASSVVFGLAAFLIAAGFVMKSWRSVVVAVVVLLLFSGIFYGVLPRSGPISWEGHLCGAAAGVWTALGMKRPA